MLTPISTALVDHHEWRSAAFAEGASEGVRLAADGLVVDHPIGRENGYDYARWTSPPHATGFGATQVVPSWNADTPAGTWIRIDLRGPETGWYVMGRWAFGDTDIARSTVSGQSDENGRVDVDTFRAAEGHSQHGFQLRVTLYRAAGTTTTPTLLMVGAMASAVPDAFTVPASAPGPASGVELAVPRYSQNTHVGGEALCSPTSTAMVLEYWGRGPKPEELDPNLPDPRVEHAAEHVYDHDYEGAGNWPFNTAYAAAYGLRGHITRLRSLPELEEYIVRGVPVITSQSFREDELDGAGYGTEGHIMVVVGFTEAGDVIANDPASSSNETVRHVYPRAQFETVWLRTKRLDEDGAVAEGPGGVVYVIEPAP
ncbi:peptidase C39 family protein [Umezawaea endophytica]|uniref:Peptidase C39 family protein n=1 Tax=Umezawaea endophytica TaxID=1654476 RepID=A0A9X2VL14_9PSEU|nr:peptidase C39 family protein [Umezawaea endophytica]MCS7478074.1 peptidase C39 family protein [Umezawaea endophytica]